MKQYLLDTDVCIEIIKHNVRVLDKIESVGEDNCYVTDITVDLKPLLPSLRLYGENKALLEDQGRIIGEFDLLIGSCAVFNGLIMVTSNLKHFDHIPDIRLEDWAQKSKYMIQ